MKTICIDGLDKVGKHTAVLSVAELLLANNYHVVMIDFPQYWFFGHVIRHILNTPELNKITNNNPKLETELRCTAYALDRLFAILNVESILKNKNHEDEIILSDRGWTSNAVTVGYGLSSKYIEEKDLEEIISKFNIFDKGFLDYFKPVSVVLDVDGKSAHELGLMEREDLYEQPDPQLKSRIIYKEYLKLPFIYTQNNGVWKNKLDIASEILNFAEVKYEKKSGNLDNLVISGPDQFFDLLFKNNKEKIFGNLLTNWIEIYKTGDKAQLKDLENRIASIAIKNIEFAYKLDTTSKTFHENINNLFNLYPELRSLIELATNKIFAEYIISLM